MLHCDEADALFGKRAEVTEGLDRYANIETSFLLQRMESYSGIVILSTNMYKALDNAFLRRINYKIKFEVPGQEERLEIWKRMFPRNTPVESIKFENLASLKLTGGSIRNICLHASFFAAEEELPVNNSHINRALQIEYTKLGQTLTDTQFIP